MKKVLITGAGSYIGVNVERWLLKWPEKYKVEVINMIDGSWREKSFEEVDVIFHVAGIAHIRETKENAHLYYDVNENLAIETAVKAKAEGVKQFIILSTMSVYGLTTGHITKNTKPNPINSYGKAKLNADVAIEKMNCPSFKVDILRPPMVYGKECKGNYQTLRKFALMVPFFPNYQNKRSMIYVGNLAAFVQDIIDREKSGLFFPQDAEYVCTADMVAKIASKNGHRVLIIRGWGWIIKLMLCLNIKIANKVFGNLTYEKADLVSDISFDVIMDYVESDKFGR